jgi:hypothetical protein
MIFWKTWTSNKDIWPEERVATAFGNKAYPSTKEDFVKQRVNNHCDVVSNDVKEPSNPLNQESPISSHGIAVRNRNRSMGGVRRDQLELKIQTQGMD